MLMALGERMRRAVVPHPAAPAQPDPDAGVVRQRCDGGRGTGSADCACVIVDAHNDVLLELLIGGGEEPSLELILREGEDRLFERYWLPRLEAGGVGVQICPLYGACAPGDGWRGRALAQEAELMRAVEANAERVCLVRTRGELEDPRLRLVLSMEGVEPLEGDSGAFEEWYERGVRSAGLTWNHANEFAGGIDTPAQGLTERGRTLVRRFAELGVVLDLAHASERTWRDVVAEEVPFSVTHAGCRAVCDHPRNLADWQLQALAECGGVLGMMAIPFVIDREAPTLRRWVDHFDHAVAVMGIKHVGLGADFNDQATPTEHRQGLDDAPNAETVELRKQRLALDGFAGPEDYPALVSALRERGYDGERLGAILSANWLRVLRAALPA
jgi:membrane dipeptidase